MRHLSVVIITKNEATNITACIESARLISNDIIVVDAESEDDTVALAVERKANVISLKWQGYGNAKNVGSEAAKYDWIFSLDADERITPILAQRLKQLLPGDEQMVYGFRRRNFFEEKELKFGELGLDKVARLYNRTVAKWDHSLVHEKLVGVISKKYFKEPIDHFTIKSYYHFKHKNANYAYLCALKYMQQGKSPSLIKRLLSAQFNFIKSYFLFLGFLDGKEGLAVARVSSYYTWLKYHHLYNLAAGYTKESIPDTTTFFDVDFNSFVK